MTHENEWRESFPHRLKANSYGLIASVTGPVHTVTNTWEGTRDVLDKKENKVGATNISTFDYSVNSIGQRSAVDVSGSAFGTQADWNWGYDSLGQVVSAQHVNTGASSRHYTFDAIGNRTQHREGGHTSSTGTATNYTPTALNQYSAVASLSPTYDSDGNMTSGPIPNAPTVLATFTWDGENRQLSVTPNGGSTTTALRDAMGRRVAKTTGSTRTYFLYDGWNIAAEYTGSVHTTGTPPALTLERTNVWGTDLSGSQQGAGGVGGLLATYLHNAGGDSGVYYPTYDGNGNVSEYLNGSGAVQAHFEYDPFGNTLVNTDTNSYFPIRFSTKYLDFESGMIHYGGREYEPFTGRWVSRDPIGIRGGLNLNGFVRNEPLTKFDPHGYKPQEIKCNGVCGAIIDDWFLDELLAQFQGWDKWKRDNKAKGTINEYLPWANGNQRYKDPKKFTFNKGTNCGTADTPEIQGSGCGSAVTLCGNCVRSSILGNLVYGIVGRYAGFTDLQLNTATKWKKDYYQTVDPYDEVAYAAGALIYGAGFEDVYDVPHVCEKVNAVLRKNPTALYEGRKDGGHNDLSTCRPCNQKTLEKRHGGSEEKTYF